jgi:hypothetical protein
VQKLQKRMLLTPVFIFIYLFFFGGGCIAIFNKGEKQFLKKLSLFKQEITASVSYVKETVV